MFQHILLPTDGSELASAAVDKGIALAKALGARVTLVAVIEQVHVLTLNPTQLAGALKSYREKATQQASKLLADATAKAEAAGVAVETVIRIGDAPGEEITRAASEVGADLIGMASHGRRGLSALMLGSQTARVLALAKVPVLVFR